MVAPKLLPCEVAESDDCDPLPLKPSTLLTAATYLCRCHLQFEDKGYAPPSARNHPMHWQLLQPVPVPGPRTTPPYITGHSALECFCDVDEILRAGGRLRLRVTRPIARLRGSE